MDALSCLRDLDGAAKTLRTRWSWRSALLLLLALQLLLLLGLLLCHSKQHCQAHPPPHTRRRFRLLLLLLPGRCLPLAAGRRMHDSLLLGLLPQWQPQVLLRCGIVSAAAG